MGERRCRDCDTEGITSKRKAPYPGPRCASHNRERRKQVRDRTHGNRILATYGITETEYWELYEFQGGVCAICQRSTGKGKRKLSVDHDHKTLEIRGECCLPCNRNVLGWLRDDMDALQRAVDYLRDPPARRFFGGPRYVPNVD